MPYEKAVIHDVADTLVSLDRAYRAASQLDDFASAAFGLDHAKFEHGRAEAAAREIDALLFQTFRRFMLPQILTGPLTQNSSPAVQRVGAVTSLVIGGLTVIFPIELARATTLGNTKRVENLGVRVRNREAAVRSMIGDSPLGQLVEAVEQQGELSGTVVPPGKLKPMKFRPDVYKGSPLRGQLVKTLGWEVVNTFDLATRDQFSRFVREPRPFEAGAAREAAADLARYVSEALRSSEKILQHPWERPLSDDLHAAIGRLSQSAAECKFDVGAWRCDDVVEGMKWMDALVNDSTTQIQDHGQNLYVAAAMRSPSPLFGIERELL